VLIGELMYCAAAAWGSLMALVTARYWRWGFTVTGHLFILFLLLVNALILPWHDGGYPLAQPFAVLLMSAVLIWGYEITAFRPCSGAMRPHFAGVAPDALRFRYCWQIG